MERKRRRQLAVLVPVLTLALIAITVRWWPRAPNPTEADSRREDTHASSPLEPAPVRSSPPPEAEPEPPAAAFARVMVEAELPATVIRAELPGECVGCGIGRVDCMAHLGSGVRQKFERRIAIGDSPRIEFRGIAPGGKTLILTWRRDDSLRVAFLVVTAIEGETVDAGTFCLGTSRISLRIRCEDPEATGTAVDVVALIISPDSRSAILPSRFEAEVGQRLDLWGFPAGVLRVDARETGETLDARSALHRCEFDGEELEMELVLRKPAPPTGAVLSVELPMPAEAGSGRLRGRFVIVGGGIVKMSTPRTMPLDHAITTRGLDPGEYRVLAFTDRARFESVPFSVGKDGEVPVKTGRWTRGSGPTVSVMNHVGEPVAGARVIVRHDASVEDGSPAVLFTETGENGRVKLPALPALDGLSVLVRHDGRIYSPVAVSWREESRLIEVALAPPRPKRD